MIFSIVSSQKLANQAGAYATADLQTLFQAGIDVITTPGAGGLQMWTARCGHNASSNAATNGDNYTRLTNYIAVSMNASMGVYIGQVINNTLFQNIRSTQLSFFANMALQGLLGTTSNTGSGLPYAVVCDVSNNPPSRQALNYVQSDCQVQYQGINEKFIVNIQGGETVTMVTSQQVIINS
jgi:hypothetical protein